MLDAKFIRHNAEQVRAAIAAKGGGVDLDIFLARDNRRREILGEVERLKHRRNQASQEIGRIKREGGNADALASEARTLGETIKDLDAELKGVEEEMERLRAWIPNVPHPSVPVGGADVNLCVRTWGEPSPPREYTRPHYVLAENLGIIDFKRAAKLSGSGFAVLAGSGARLNRALIQFMLDLHTREHGYTEIAPPHIVRRECLFGTGQLPKLEEDMYGVPVDDYFLIPTAEVPLTNLYRDETFEESDLPVRLTAYTACFRREAGAYGKDTRGLQRLHQFDKVELVKFVNPETSYDELESLVANAETVLQRLELPYRVMLLASGDLSFAASKCYDLELWAPAEQKWLEVSSCSNFESFQARRIGIRVRSRDGSGSRFLHTLNGSGVALPRLLIAILETYQTPEGTVRIPDALVPYVGGMTEIR